MLKTYKEYLKELRKIFKGDIETNFSQRFVQSTDNSIYQYIPEIVIYPKSKIDIKNAISLAHNLPQIKFTARGGGTGTNGQSLNYGIIIDCTRYFRNILKLNLTQEYLEVEPGVTLFEVNRYLAKKGYFFASHVSPHDRATIGGMIATDACGHGSFIHGKTSDHLISAQTILADGSEFIFEKNTKTTNKKAKEVKELLQKNQKLIKEKIPTHPRFATGFNLTHTLKNNQLNLNYLFAGSEGTIGILTKAKIRITKLQPEKAVLIAHYKNFNDAVTDPKNLVKFKPYAIETMDENILDLSRKTEIFQNHKNSLDIKNSNSINIIELRAETKKQLELNIQKFIKNYKGLALTLKIEKETESIKNIWALRSEAVGIAGSLSGTKKPIAFIEDTAIELSKIPNYIKDLKKILDSYKLNYVFYGHLDIGCIHVRPALDLRLKKEQEIMLEIKKKTLNLVKKYKGVMWGEHGVGLRVSYQKDLYGKEIYQIFKDIKNIFDSFDILNPGKITCSKKAKLNDNLQADFNAKIDKNFYQDFSTEIFCNGNTKCLSVNKTQEICPSYKATKEKIHSPKGRANLIRNWLKFRSEIKLPKNIISKKIYKIKFKKSLKEIYDSLDACLGCKACSTTCPVQVNIPKAKSNYLNWYHKIYNRPFRDYFFGFSEFYLKFLAKFSFLLNFLSPIKFTNNLGQKEIKKRIYKNQKLDSNHVLILTDSFNNYLDSNMLIDSINFLEKIGYKTLIINNINSGIGLLHFGFLEKFKKLANKNIRFLNHIKAPIITLEPAIQLTYTKDYQEFASNKQTYQIDLISNFLNQNLDKIKKLKSKKPQTKYMLAHCSEKTCLPDSIKSWQNIYQALGHKLEILESGCCGMSGSFGLEKKNQKISKRLFNMSWEEHFKTKKQILMTGFSCRKQAERFTNKKIQNPLCLS